MSIDIGHGHHEYRVGRALAIGESAQDGCPPSELTMDKGVEAHIAAVGSVLRRRDSTLSSCCNLKRTGGQARPPAAANRPRLLATGRETVRGLARAAVINARRPSAGRSNPDDRCGGAGTELDVIPGAKSAGKMWTARDPWGSSLSVDPGRGHGSCSSSSVIQDLFPRREPLYRVYRG